MTIEYFHSTDAECEPETLYRILWLRLQVFVVEQEAAYPDIDGRDIEPGAELMWAGEGGEVLSTLRILRDTVGEDAGGLRIGRVATASAARSRGVASELMRRAVARCEELDPTATIALDAQKHLGDWYARFGFVVDGPEFAEDGIPHLPMRRAAAG